MDEKNKKKSGKKNSETENEKKSALQKKDETLELTHDEIKSRDAMNEDQEKKQTIAQSQSDDQQQQVATLVSEEKKNNTPNSDEEEDDKTPGMRLKPNTQIVVPVLPLRDIIIFPGMIVPLFVGRAGSIEALKNITQTENIIFLVTQKEADIDDPKPNQLFDIGVLAYVLQVLELQDGTTKILVEALQRGKIQAFNSHDSFLEARVLCTQDIIPESLDIDSLRRSGMIQFENYVKLGRRLSQDIISSIAQIDDPGRLADSIVANLNMKMTERQDILATLNVGTRLEKVLRAIEDEIGALLIEKKVRARIKKQMEKTQKEYYLNEQLHAIQKELGDLDSDTSDTAELERKLKALKLDKEAQKKVDNELRRLKSMSSTSAESAVIRNYLEWIASIPWYKKRPIKRDLEEAKRILDRDHYGLDKVKERIIEYLTVQKRKNKLKGPILCFVGPPGVGKTSLGKSIAEATGREFVRLALGGVRDEAEIRGHRRTYIGALPGRVIQSMKRIKYVNPLFLFDEIDKLGSDYRGDPAAALLEVLDSEQNNAFVDHYLELDYDLSDIMFITTANTLNISPALVDRLEIIRLSGYTEDEKIEICQRHLFQSSMNDHGIKDNELSIDRDAFLRIIRVYTREAGVRSLERMINKIARKALRKIISKGVKSVHIHEDDLTEFLGVPKYHFGEIEEKDSIGLVTGLAWTEVGGDILTIEAIAIPGRGQMIVTGNLKDVMKESISAANSYVRARAMEFGIHPSFLVKKDIHVHVPEGATPKDGPSAGIAMVTAIVSLMTGIPIRKDTAMTGEVTLRGRVLPIGGLKEKLLAALRSGIKTVLIPKDNARELAEIPDNVKNGLSIIPVGHVEEVLTNSLLYIPKPNKEWDESLYVPCSSQATLLEKNSSPFVMRT